MTKTIRCIEILLLQILFCLTAIAQQPKLEWAQRFNGKDNTWDHAVAVAADAKGNSYVTGTSEFGRIATVKYSPSGEQLWEVQVESYSEAQAIVVDSAGGVFVTGEGFSSESGSDYITVRYDASTGVETWTNYYDGPGSGYDETAAIAVDNAGGVYVTGFSRDSIIGTDYATVRYDAATGQESWVRHYSGPDGRADLATAIATDNQGGVYVTGQSYDNDFVNHSITIRYAAATGEESWISHYVDSESSYHVGTAIAVDNKGGVYVTGYGRGSDYDYAGYLALHYLTVRFDAATGEQTWAQGYNGPDSDLAAAIAVDRTGGVYVTGYSRSSESVADYTTIRYDAATGEEAWVSHYNGPGNTSDEATAIAVDNQGGVYVTGYSYGSDSPEAEYATIRYDAATGEEDWVSRMEAYYRIGFVDASDIAVDNRGGVYTAGTSIGDTTTSDYVTARYAASTGEETWIRRYDRIESTSEIAIAVAVDAEGNSYVTGTSPKEGIYRATTVKYSPSGQQLWVAQLGEGSSAVALAVDNSGGLFVTGDSHSDDGASTTFMIRYDANTGEEIWKSRYEGSGNSSDTGTPNAIAVDSAGGVYVTGYNFGDGDSDDTSPDYLTIRYDAATGEQTWVRFYDGPEHGYDRAAAIVVDNRSGIYITGYSINGTFSNTDYTTIRYDAATGQEVWVRHYDGPDSDDEIATAIAVDSQGSVYVTGYSGYTDSNYATVRYDAATGEEIWAKHYEGPGNTSDEAVAIAVDNAGGVYVTGHSSAYNAAGDLTAADYTTVRYDAGTGERTWASNYKGPGNSVDQAIGVVADKQGGIYVSGYSFGSDTGFDLATVRYDAISGVQAWAERYTSAGSNEDVALDMALDKDGNLIITGYSYGGSDTYYDFLTLKYSQQEECPVLAEAEVSGYTTVSSGFAGAAYYLSAPGATSFAWSITDPDGNPYTAFTGQGTPSISVDWPEEPNAYKLSVTYSGKEGCPYQTSLLYVHVYDPDAGFVSGGGWSDSPASAEYELMERGGKLYWGFAARYRGEDADRVQGSALVMLETGPSAFRATTVEPGSLVIAGDRAFFRGTGTLTWQEGLGTRTDERRFGYLVAATDGQLGEGDDADRLRLRVWVLNDDGTEGETVYDNQVSCPSASLDGNAPACAGIDKGNVIIHRPGVRGLAGLLSLNAAAAPQGLQAYPTAFSDRTTIAFSLEEGEAYELELYDLKGALVQRIATGSAEVGRRYEHELRAEGLAKGLYLARLTSGEKVQTVKLVVER